ncbi:MAG: phosphoglycolate phosphatase [Pseudomonadota bacterium]
MTHTIVFDLDGTLVDTAPDLWRAMNHALSSEGFPTVDVSAVHGLVGQGALVMLRRGLAVTGQSVGEETVKKLHGLFLEYYRENLVVDSKPYPSVEAVLNHLRTDGHILAVCTNKYEEFSRELLQNIDFAKYFDVIAGPETFGVRKPDPAHIIKTVEAAGGSPDRAVMIGDSVADIDAAKAARIPVIAVSFGYTDKPVNELGPDTIIDHYDELTPALQPYLAA